MGLVSAGVAWTLELTAAVSKGTGRPARATARRVAALACLTGIAAIVMLAVPLLVAASVPMLLAVGTAQVQSVFVAAFATIGYVARDAVAWPLVVAIGVPELVGVVVRWKVAQSVDVELLTACWPH